MSAKPRAVSPDICPAISVKKKGRKKKKVQDEVKQDEVKQEQVKQEQQSPDIAVAVATSSASVKRKPGRPKKNQTPPTSEDSPKTTENTGNPSQLDPQPPLDVQTPVQKRRGRPPTKKKPPEQPQPSKSPIIEDKVVEKPPQVPTTPPSDFHKLVESTKNLTVSLGPRVEVKLKTQEKTQPEPMQIDDVIDSTTKNEDVAHALFDSPSKTLPPPTQEVQKEETPLAPPPPPSPSITLAHSFPSPSITTPTKASKKFFPTPEPAQPGIIPGFDFISQEIKPEPDLGIDLANFKITSSVANLVKSMLNKEKDEEEEEVEEKRAMVKPPKKKEVKEDREVKEEEKESESETKIRRSSRIKTLEGSKVKRRGSEQFNISDISVSGGEMDRSWPPSESGSASNTPPPQDSGSSTPSYSSSPSFGSFPPPPGLLKAQKLKSRWRESLDADVRASLSENTPTPAPPTPEELIKSRGLARKPGFIVCDPTDPEINVKLRDFEGIEENIYRKGRRGSKDDSMWDCDCFQTKEEVKRGEMGCRESCLNRMVMVECGENCSVGDRCANKMFQKKRYCPLEVFKTEKKGHGLRTMGQLEKGGFVIEYVGEVLDTRMFNRRIDAYAKSNQEHFYFMSLKVDAIIDATTKGNCSRFINHSCEPNCETQKWTVDGELRIGFFALRDLEVGEEITFDYQFERYGKSAQKCYCESPSCRGWIGGTEDSEEFDDKENEVSGVERGLKPRVKTERKRRKEIKIEDKSLKEDLAKLEQSGMKNRNHTLMLVRLIIRAEDWDIRERILNILLNGETPCRRLFLDYHGLKHLYNWMKVLPLPNSEEDSPQLIQDECYHNLFLNVLKVLPIPNKNLLVDSKILDLLDTWSNAPQRTLTITKSLPKALESIPQTPDEPDSNSNSRPATPKPSEEDSSVPGALEEGVLTGIPDLGAPQGISEDSEPKVEDMEVENDVKFILDGIIMKLEANETFGGGVQDEEEKMEVEEKDWGFVNVTKTVLEGWKDLQEVYRIPKKERVEQMKKHEVEADDGWDDWKPKKPAYSSYDRHKGSFQSRYDKPRRVPALVNHTFGGSYRPPGGPKGFFPEIDPNLSKEERRVAFEMQFKQREEEERARKLQGELIELHKNRCIVANMDSATTPMVDPSGEFYLNPKTMAWLPIDPDDPATPPSCILLMQAMHYQTPEPPEPTIPPAELIGAPNDPEKFEFLKTQWPPDQPPPPPLPPTELPPNWRMAQDELYRIYYYNILTKQRSWAPPEVPEVEEDEEEYEEGSTDEDDEEEEEAEEDNPSKTRLDERRERRIKSGLVVETLMSPRTEEEKEFLFISPQAIKARKEEQYEKKLIVLKCKEAGIIITEDDLIEEKLLEHSLEEQELIKGIMAESAVSSLKEKKRREMSRKAKHRRLREEAAAKAAKAKLKERQVREAKEEEDAAKVGEINDGGSLEGAAEGSEVQGKALEEPMDVKEVVQVRLKDPEVKKRRPKKDARGLHIKLKRGPGPSSSSGVGVTEEQIIGAWGGNDKEGRKRREAAKDEFKREVSKVVVAGLNSYRKLDCGAGRIKTSEDFKHLARKLTNQVTLKEMKHCREGKLLEVTDSVRHKTREFVKKYMGKYGPGEDYVPSPPPQDPKV